MGLFPLTNSTYTTIFLFSFFPYLPFLSSLFFNYPTPQRVLPLSIGNRGGLVFYPLPLFFFLFSIYPLSNLNINALHLQSLSFITTTFIKAHFPRSITFVSYGNSRG